MKAKYWLALILTFTCGSKLMAAQVPSGSTGQCRDGSYTSAVKKAGACSGHKGVQTWFAATGSVTATTNASVPVQQAAPTRVATSKQTSSSRSAPSPAMTAVPAQTTAATQNSAPSGSTGQCKDGSYTNAAKKAGACSGHKGVQTWFAAAGSTPATVNAAAPVQQPVPASAPAATQTSAPRSLPSSSMTAAQPQTTNQEPTPAAAQAPSRSSTSSSAPRPQAAGAGPGMVWVNLATKVYHCPGTRFYGTTKSGQYMSETDALGMGARADHNQPCAR